MTDEQWLRLELKNAEARRHPHAGGSLAARVARLLHLHRRPAAA